MTQILSGKELSQKIKDEIKSSIEVFVSKGLRKPKLALLIVGDDPASNTYVNSKAKSSAELNIDSIIFKLEINVEEKVVLDKIAEWNADNDLDGILVQLPLPKHIDENKVIEAIDPKKDVDGFHPISVGRNVIGLEAFLPCTPYGILEMIRHFGIDTQGKECVVVGRSNIVGKPMLNLMYQKNIANATTTIAHTGTKNLKEITKRADILITAMGSPLSIKEDFVKDGAVVIDVGINRIEDSSKQSGFRLVGDVDFDNVKDKVSAITPVPGGVGLMTIAMLMKNTLHSYKRRLGLE
jgi:methylenetetrahydrofolate dehydrogenase (NADP+)/methenyltetrahydrofolate cyclohydrolase